MKKLFLAVMCVLILAPSAYSWQFVLHDDLGREFRLDVAGKIGQNFVLEGVVVNGGVEDQECVLYANLIWMEVLLNALPNDLYYGNTLIGPWGVAGGFQWTITNGGYESGHSLDMGPLPPLAEIKKELYTR
jgi:hypothetical protein